MKANRKLRKFWHDLYYQSSSDKLSDFALKCRDVSADIDLHRQPRTLKDHFRLWLHFSLCQGCKDYSEISKALSNALRKRTTMTSVQADDLNKRLLDKYGRLDDASKIEKD